MQTTESFPRAASLPQGPYRLQEGKGGFEKGKVVASPPGPQRGLLQPGASGHLNPPLSCPQQLLAWGLADGGTGRWHLATRTDPLQPQVGIPRPEATVQPRIPPRAPPADQGAVKNYVFCLLLLPHTRHPHGFLQRFVCPLVTSSGDVPSPPWANSPSPPPLFWHYSRQKGQQGQRRDGVTLRAQVGRGSGGRWRVRVLLAVERGVTYVRVWKGWV